MSLAMVTDDAQRTNMPKIFSSDFEHLSYSLGRITWTSEFVLHQKDLYRWPYQGKSVKEIQDDVSGFTPFVDDVLQLLMNPLITTDVFVLDYAKECLAIEDWESFMARAVRLTRLQSYKGAMLSAMSDWTKEHMDIDFVALLTEQVKRHGE